jgi:hypothetical protein
MKHSPGALALVVAALAIPPSAGCTRNVAANALIATGATIAAAAAIRAATQSCYATCTYGTVCNHRTGLCEAQTPEQVRDHCVDDLGENHCDPTTQASTGTPVPEEDDPCAGMCLEGETCVMRHGNLTCEGTPKTKAAPTNEEDDD